MKEISVSIIIPVYNGANYLKSSIESALAQSYKNIEVIVINDGSTDNGETERIALSYGDKIRYFYKENGGISSTLNYGITKMNNSYFSWLSHDDLYNIDKIKNQVKCVESKNDIILCSGDLLLENKKKLPFKPKLLNGYYTGYSLFYEYLNGYLLNGLGFLIHKQVIIENGMFNEQMKYLQDTDLWFRLLTSLNKYNFICLDQILVTSRIHSMQTTNLLPRCWKIDCVYMAKKEMNRIKSLPLSQSKESCRLYMFYFLKVLNISGVKLYAQYLKSIDSIDFCTFIRGGLYLNIGILKYVYRKLYNLYFSLLHVRN